VSVFKDTLVITSVIAFAYFAILNVTYVIFTAIAWRDVTRYRRGRSYAAVEEVFASPLTPPISVIVPAFNEEAGIVESVRSLLALRYPEFEVIVVNDGSADRTLGMLADAFELLPVRKALRGTISTARVRAAYSSRRHRDLWVIDKENGGKADAINAGVNAARYPYFCVLDADAMLEEDALLRVAKPMLDDPDLVAATGGIIRVVNGSRVDHGRVLEVGLPKSWLATVQVVEYFRAFLVGRIGWSRMRSLLIISGAFGLFRRNLVEAAGGFSNATVTEDLELVVRLHRHLRQRGEDYRIAFVPDPVAWTEAPEELRSLRGQRSRWQRGLGQALWLHRGMAGNPRYGTVGLVAFPYFVVFELLGPLVELLGYVAVIAAAATGALSLAFVGAFFAAAVLVGFFLSLSALALEEFSFRRYVRGREVGRLLVAAVIENFGYRQLLALWRTRALVELARGRHEWGEMQRRGLGYAPAGEPSGGR
jgi:cellulose synthase/poly-beta-1,6-N-acetylglucosamine synthase-like glycosyltransferase